jgi:hypothetical protein
MALWWRSHYDFSAIWRLTSRSIALSRAWRGSSILPSTIADRGGKRRTPPRRPGSSETLAACGWVESAVSRLELLGYQAFELLHHYYSSMGTTRTKVFLLLGMNMRSQASPSAALFT